MRCDGWAQAVLACPSSGRRRPCWRCPSRSGLRCCSRRVSTPLLHWKVRDAVGARYAWPPTLAATVRLCPAPQLPNMKTRFIPIAHASDRNNKVARAQRLRVVATQLFLCCLRPLCSSCPRSQRFYADHIYPRLGLLDFILFRDASPKSRCVTFCAGSSWKSCARSYSHCCRSRGAGTLCCASVATDRQALAESRCRQHTTVLLIQCAILLRSALDNPSDDILRAEFIDGDNDPGQDAVWPFAYSLVLLFLCIFLSILVLSLCFCPPRSARHWRTARAPCHAMHRIFGRGFKPLLARFVLA